MPLVIDPEFLAERARFALVHCCEACVYFDAPRERCTHGWPTEPHRAARYERGEVGADLSFCKEFEIA